MNGSYGDLFDSTFHIPPWWSSSQSQLVVNDDLAEQEEEESDDDYSVQYENWSRNQESQSSLLEVSSCVKEEVDRTPLQAAAATSR